ncbi:carbohydrate ABC transporter permease [Pseudarthrobacter sp. DSP2-3-2b1]|uniref:carbohydrate ABC transporter permease n=1 Tax=Pseudarthrobacter sp. DSP2-3-2b1 TaxID=2804661 RepID=UPI003CEE2316
MNRYTWRTGVREAGMILVALTVMIPLYILVNLALKKEGDLGSPLQPVTSPTFENFSAAWTEAGLGPAMFYTATITLLSLVLIVFMAAMAAYPLARITRTWSKLVFVLFMAGLLLPVQLALFPLYSTMRDLGLLNSVWALVIYYTGHIVPFSVFLYTSFLRTMPTDFEEAARIDGASPFRTFWSVVFPLARPVTGTVIILNAIGIWNDFLTPLLYLSGSKQQTIPVALYSFLGQYESRWQLVFAGLIIGLAPILVIYFLLQKYIIQGFAGGLKG